MVQTLGPEDSLEVNRLVSKAFGYIPPHSFFDDFPVWDLTLHPKGFGQDTQVSYGIKVNQTLVAHVGARIAELNTPLGTEKIGLIGAVATDAFSRGKGYSTTLLKQAIHHLESHQCKWQILWGSEHDFYAKLGFTLQGVQARGFLKELWSTPPLLKSREIKTEMDESIFKFLNHAPLGLKIGPQDRQWVYSQKTISWSWIENPFAFVAFGKGMDMGHIVHEFGGERESLLILLHALFEKDPFVQVIGTPQSLIQLGFEKDLLIRESLGLIRGQGWQDDFWISGLGAC